MANQINYGVFVFFFFKFLCYFIYLILDSLMNTGNKKEFRFEEFNFP